MFEKYEKYFNSLIKKAKKQKEKTIFEKINDLYDSLNGDTICIKLGSDLVEFGDDISKYSHEVRTEIKEKTGFILPAVRFLENDDIQENEIEVVINSVSAFSEFVIPTKENFEKDLKAALNKIYKDYLKDIFTNEMVEKYIDVVKKDNYKMAVEVCYKLASVEIKYILVDLLLHEKSINNIVLIFEKIAERIYIDNSYLSEDVSSLSKEIIKNI
ncbi:hypothetical protein IJD44_10880 [bacterium]|nr:hypothetical protein [bacterium]